MIFYTLLLEGDQSNNSAKLDRNLSNSFGIKDFLSFSYRYTGEIMPHLLAANFFLPNHDGCNNLGEGLLK